MPNTLKETELRALETNGTPLLLPKLDPRKEEDLLFASLRITLAINRKIMEAISEDRVHEKKADATPATQTDRNCEWLAKEMYGDAFGNRIAFMGEEFGGEFSEDGYCVAIDPIDGTWGFIGDNGTYGTSISVYKDGKPHMGVVSQPSASELTYAIGDHPTRLLRNARWGVGPAWQTMPQVRNQETILVNVQGNKKERPLLETLYRAWEEGTISQVRSSGGSPAVSMADVSKGSTMYMNAWNKPSSPHDLGAGLKIVENAGGEIVDMDGNPIEAVGHKGLFIAGLRAEHRKIVREILQKIIN